MDRALLSFVGPVAISFLAASFPVSLFAGQNCQFTLPLHAVVGSGGACLTGGPDIDCREVRPTVNVPPNVDSRIYLLIYHASAVTSVQTAFEWDPSWDLIRSEWQCQVGQVTTHVPDPSSPTGGPTDGCARHVLRLHLESDDDRGRTHGLPDWLAGVLGPG